MEVRCEGRVAHALVHGELDIATTPGLRAAVDAAIADGAAELVVDLTTAGFVDSTACGYLLQLARASTDGGPPSGWCAPSPTGTCGGSSTSSGCSRPSGWAPTPAARGRQCGAGS